MTARPGRARGSDGKLPPVVVPIPEERRIGALAARFRRVLRTPLIVANTAAGVAAFGVILVAGQPAIGLPLLLRMPIAIGVFVLVACAALPYLLRGPARAALESFAWIGRWDALRWSAVTGVKPLATPEAARAWLDANPMRGDAPPPVRLARIEPLLLVGDVAAASKLAAGLPADSPWDRFDREYQRAFVDFSGGGRVDPRPLRAAAVALADPEERLRGQALLALGAARVAVAAGDDWIAPLADVREAIGEVGDGVLRLEVWPTLFRLEVVVALAAGVLGVILVGLG
ncbi:MAG: hypothetical protein WCH74_08395 [Chloroflexota bacterium]